MTFRDMIKNSVLEAEAYASQNIAKIIVSLALAILLGCLIYMVYRKFYAGVVFSKSFAVTLIGMTVMTCMVTLAISSNLVISLGMVGALSIVRYRTAIKDPLDLLYMFWAITTGITVGAGMYLLCILASAAIIVIIFLFYSRPSKGRIYIAIFHYNGDHTGDQIIQQFGKMKFFIKSKTLKKDYIEMAVELFLKDNNMMFLEKLRDIEGVRDVTVIQYNGEYHG